MSAAARCVAGRRELTPRQRQVLTMAANGYTITEIGRQLGVGPQVVKFHRGRIIERLDAANMTNAVAIAIWEGLL